MGSLVTLYVKPGCPHCFAAKRDLDNRGVAYQEINVQQDRAALAQMLALNGGRRHVPTIVEGDKVTVGFKGGY